METGAAVSSLYAEERAEARGWARLRNTCFQQVGVSVGQGWGFQEGGRDGVPWILARAHVLLAVRVCMTQAGPAPFLSVVG